jgi:3-phenylpropionate/trans-cinnamate dioxygenase ferredoxin reductase component
MNATEQGMAAARTLLGSREPYAPVPYFWSEQFGVRIQAYGHTGGDTRLELTEQDTSGFAGLYLDADRIVGAVAWNRPRAARVLHHRVAEAMQQRT